MCIRPEQLRRNLEAMDSEALHAKAQSGALTQDALFLVLDILKSRGFEAGAESTSAQSEITAVPAFVPPIALPGGTIAKMLLRLYVAFAGLCTVLVFFDPPWVKAGNGTWEGMFGFMASVASGAPWSILLLFSQVGRLSEAQFVAMNFGCVALNLVLFVLYIRRT